MNVHLVVSEQIVLEIWAVMSEMNVGDLVMMVMALGRSIFFVMQMVMD